MIYILAFVALIGIYTYVNQRSRINVIKRNGVKATGVIVQNRDTVSTDKLDFYRLGGNINDPIVRFATEDGQIITGRPVVGFITQYEVDIPKQINIVYNSKNPKQFYIDFG